MKSDLRLLSRRANFRSLAASFLVLLLPLAGKALDSSSHPLTITLRPAAANSQQRVPYVDITNAIVRARAAPTKAALTAFAGDLGVELARVLRLDQAAASDVEVLPSCEQSRVTLARELQRSIEGEWLRRAAAGRGDARSEQSKQPRKERPSGLAGPAAST